MTDEKIETLELIELVYEIIKKSSKVPISGKVMVDREEVLGILDEIINKYPKDIRTAQWITKRKDEMLSYAQERINEANSKSIEIIENQVNNNDIVQQAKLIANEIESAAEEEARKLKIYARQYADELLTEVEKEIQNTTSRLLNHMKEDMEAFAIELTKNMDKTTTVIRENIKELRAPLNSK